MCLCVCVCVCCVSKKKNDIERERKQRHTCFWFLQYEKYKRKNLKKKQKKNKPKTTILTMQTNQKKTKNKKTKNEKKQTIKKNKQFKKTNNKKNKKIKKKQKNKKNKKIKKKQKIKKKECLYDGEDCLPTDFSLCNTTDCGSLKWLNDGFCDTSCNNTLCGFDGGDCLDCSERCITFVQLYDQIANLQTQDDKINSDELCDFKWFLLNSYDYQTAFDFNCTEIVKQYDYTNDSSLNAKETSIFLAYQTSGLLKLLFNDTADRIQQADCSACYPNWDA